jgi:hypothetical protein
MKKALRVLITGLMSLTIYAIWIKWPFAWLGINAMWMVRSARCLPLSEKVKLYFNGLGFFFFRNKSEIFNK